MPRTAPAPRPPTTLRLDQALEACIDAWGTASFADCHQRYVRLLLAASRSDPQLRRFLPQPGPIRVASATRQR